MSTRWLSRGRTVREYVIGALPFSLVMVLMAISVLKAIWRDSKREAQGIETTVSE